MLLALVRLWFALSPSYIHPDENFQGPEVIAGRSKSFFFFSFFHFILLSVSDLRLFSCGAFVRFAIISFSPAIQLWRCSELHFLELDMGFWDDAWLLRVMYIACAYNNLANMVFFLPSYDDRRDL